MRLDRLEVLLERAHQEAVIQRRGRVIDRDVAHAILDDQLTVQPRDGVVTREEPRQRVAAEHQDDLRMDQAQLLLEIGRACLRFGGLWVAIARWPALEDIGDEDVPARQADAAQQLVEQLSGRAHEGLALLVLVLARCLADDHDGGV